MRGPRFAGLGHLCGWPAIAHGCGRASVRHDGVSIGDDDRRCLWLTAAHQKIAIVRIEDRRQIVAARATLASDLKARDLLALAMNVQHACAVRADDARGAR